MVLDRQPLLVDAEGAAAMLGCSRSTIYKLIAVGQLHGIKVGRSRRFTVGELEAYVERLEAEGAVERGALR